MVFRQATVTRIEYGTLRMFPGLILRSAEMSKEQPKPGKKNELTRQKVIGGQIQGWGQLLLAAIVVVCMLDLSSLAIFDWVQVPLLGYLIAIFAGVAMQFVGAAIPNMKFRTSS